MKLSRLFFFTLVFFALAGFINQSLSQSIVFCEDVDDGEPVNESDTFTIPSSGGYLYALVDLDDEAGCEDFIFDIYRNNEFDNTIDVSVESDWVIFWKKINFYKPGTYIILVYNCDEELVTSGIVYIE